MNDPMAEPGGNGPTATASRIASAANGTVLFLARHWLAIFNIGWGSYVIMPFVAALFLQIGWDGPARVLYTLYSYTCHQLPDHSYFLFGPTLTPDDAALLTAGMPDTADLMVQRTFRGNEMVGYKVALCQRDLGIYGAVLAGGLLFAAVREWLRPLPLLWFVIMSLPMAIDGGTQLFGWRESNWLLRTITGGLFGVAALWWSYPYVQMAMNDILQQESARARPAAPPSH